MNYMEGDIIRYVQVIVGSDYLPWYIDLDDKAEKGDRVLVPYRYKEEAGIVAQVVRCVFPYVIYPSEKTKPVFEIIHKNT